MPEPDRSPEMWAASAEAWIAIQGENGDASRSEILDPAVDRILPNLKGLKVLDVGCGEGRYSRAMAQKGAHVTGIDPVKPFIEKAQQRHPEGRYLLGSATQMPFPDSEFDLVMSYLSLVDIADDEAASREMCRVLKPGGRLVLVTISNVASTTAEWVKDEQGNKLFRKVDRYMDTLSIELAWKGIRVVNYHRPLSRTMGGFLNNGLVLTHFSEPLPRPGTPLYDEEHRVPTFQIMVFGKPTSEPPR